MITSVLEGLLIRELFLYQFSAFPMIFSNCFFIEDMFFPVTMNWVSSAYDTTLASGKELVRSLTKQRKSIGPSMEP